MGSIRWVWGYMRRHKIQFSFGIFLALSVTFLNLLNPYFSGRIVDDVIKGNQSGFTVEAAPIAADVLH